MRVAALFAGACLLGCGAEPLGLCDGNAGLALDVTAFYRFEDVPLAAGDALPVFEPPQGGIATELDVVMQGVGFETLAFLRIDAARVDDGSPVAEVSYSGDGLPLECVRDGELKVRAIPVPFVDGSTLDTLDGRAVEVSVSIERNDGAQTQVSAVVTLDASAY